MANLEATFATAAQSVKQLPSQPDNDTLLKLYAFYKQATQGDANGKRPGFTDFVGRAKYDAWAELKGTAREAAMQSYVDLVEQLKKGK